MDLAVIKELYLQARKSKEVLFEMLFQMANPEAAQEAPIQGAFQQDASDDDENQAAMI